MGVNIYIERVSKCVKKFAGKDKDRRSRFSIGGILVNKVEEEVQERK